MAEGARLESVYALIPYRGFESLSHRHIVLGRDYGKAQYLVDSGLFVVREKVKSGLILLLTFLLGE